MKMRVSPKAIRLDQLRGARDDEQGLAILLDLGPLMGVAGVLDGELVQVELLLHRAEQRHVGFVQPDPDHMSGLGPPGRRLADGDIGDTPSVDIGAGSDDALGGHRFEWRGGSDGISGFNPGQNRWVDAPWPWPVRDTLPGEASIGKFPFNWLFLFTIWPGGQPDSSLAVGTSIMKAAILVFP